MKHSNDDMMTEAELAEFLRVSRRCVQNWRVRGGGPRYVEISRRCIRYPKREVLAWLEARTRAHTSDPNPELSDRRMAAASDAEPPLPLELSPEADERAAEEPRPASQPRGLRTLLPHDRR